MMLDAYKEIMNISDETRKLFDEIYKELYDIKQRSLDDFLKEKEKLDELNDIIVMKDYKEKMYFSMILIFDEFREIRDREYYENSENIELNYKAVLNSISSDEFSNRIDIEVSKKTLDSAMNILKNCLERKIEGCEDIILIRNLSETTPLLEVKNLCDEAVIKFILNIEVADEELDPGMLHSIIIGESYFFLGEVWFNLIRHSFKMKTDFKQKPNELKQKMILDRGLQEGAYVKASEFYKQSIKFMETAASCMDHDIHKSIFTKAFVIDRLEVIQSRYSKSKDEQELRQVEKSFAKKLFAEKLMGKISQDLILSNDHHIKNFKKLMVPIEINKLEQKKYGEEISKINKDLASEIEKYKNEIPDKLVNKGGPGSKQCIQLMIIIIKILYDKIAETKDLLVRFQEHIDEKETYITDLILKISINLYDVGIFLEDYDEFLKNADATATLETTRLAIDKMQEGDEKNAALVSLAQQEKDVQTKEEISDQKILDINTFVETLPDQFLKIEVNSKYIIEVAEYIKKTPEQKKRYIKLKQKEKEKELKKEIEKKEIIEKQLEIQSEKETEKENTTNVISFERKEEINELITKIKSKEKEKQNELIDFIKTESGNFNKLSDKKIKQLEKKYNYSDLSVLKNITSDEIKYIFDQFKTQVTKSKKKKKKEKKKDSIEDNKIEVLKKEEAIKETAKKEAAKKEAAKKEAARKEEEYQRALEEAKKKKKNTNFVKKLANLSKQGADKKAIGSSIEKWQNGMKRDKLFYENLLHKNLLKSLDNFIDQKNLKSMVDINIINQFKERVINLYYNSKKNTNLSSENNNKYKSSILNKEYNELLDYINKSKEINENLHRLQERKANIEFFLRETNPDYINEIIHLDGFKRREFERINIFVNLAQNRIRYCEFLNWAIKEKLKTVKNNQELADNSHLIIYGGFATHLYGIEKRLQPYYTQDLDIKFVCPPDSNIDIKEMRTILEDTIIENVGVWRRLFQAEVNIYDPTKTLKSYYDDDRRIIFYKDNMSTDLGKRENGVIPLKIVAPVGLGKQSVGRASSPELEFIEPIIEFTFSIDENIKEKTRKAPFLGPPPDLDLVSAKEWEGIVPLFMESPLRLIKNLLNNTDDFDEKLLIVEMDKYLKNRSGAPTLKSFIMYYYKKNISEVDEYIEKNKNLQEIWNGLQSGEKKIVQNFFREKLISWLLQLNLLNNYMRLGGV